MQEATSTETAKDLSSVIKINEHQFKDHLGKMVRSTVEETLNDMLDAEADQLCNAKKYERNDKRSNGRAGHYKRKLHTTSGEVELKTPKLRGDRFETALPSVNYNFPSTTIISSLQL